MSICVNPRHRSRIQVSKEQYLLGVVFYDLGKRLFLKAFNGNRDLLAGWALGLTGVIGGEFLPTLVATTDQPHDLDIVQAVMDFGEVKGIEPGSRHGSRAG